MQERRMAVAAPEHGPSNDLERRAGELRETYQEMVREIGESRSFWISVVKRLDEAVNFDVPDESEALEALRLQRHEWVSHIAELGRMEEEANRQLEALGDLTSSDH